MVTSNIKNMKQFIVVAYDISDDRRRQKVSKILIQYGVRCNESVFECVLSDSRIVRMKKQIYSVIDETKDSILYYYLCMPCVMKRENYGRRPELLPVTILV